MTGRAFARLHLDRSAIRAEVARQARVHGIGGPSDAMADAVTELLGVMLDEHRAAVVAEVGAAVLGACEQIEDAYAGAFREGTTVDLTLIRAAVST